MIFGYEGQIAPHEPVLECQDCGKVVRRLTPAEAKHVADQPYNHVVYCFNCARERELS